MSCRRILFLSLLVWSFPSCSPHKTNVDPVNCPLISHDQKDSFEAPIQEEFPAKVWIDPRFTAEQRRLIVQGFEKWNAFGQEKEHKAFFEIQNASSMVDFASTDPTDCQSMPGSPDSIRVYLENSEERWTSLHLVEKNDDPTKVVSHPAITLRCTVRNDTENLGNLEKQVILINTNYLNKINGKPSGVDQTVSVVTHEVGHSLGLKHSCQAGSNDNGNYISCNNINSNAAHPYRKALMFPSLTSNEVKEDLSTNDKERANCLYRNE